MRNAIVYTRYSSELQNENSTDTQLRVISEFAVRNGCNILEYFNDKATTGRHSDREEFSRMLKVIRSKQKQIDCIIVYRFSRFMRNLEESITYKRMLEKQFGIKVISATEPNAIDSGDATGQLLENILACIDQFYSDMLASMVTEGMREIVMNHYWPGGPPPFGYSLDKTENSEGHRSKGRIVERNRLVVNESEARVVRRIFEICAETGKGGHLIAQQIKNEFGIVLGRKKKPIDGSRVNDILKKTIYKGVFIYGRYTYEFEPDGDGNIRTLRKKNTKREPLEIKDELWRIMPDELWEIAQLKLAANHDPQKRFGFGNGKAAHPLTGLIECCCCKHKFASKRQTSKKRDFSAKSDYLYYRCRHAMNATGACNNRTKLIAADIEHAVIGKLLNDLLTPEFFEEIADRTLQRLRADAGNDELRLTLTARRTELSSQLERLVEIAQFTSQPVQAIAEQINKLEKEKANVERDIGRLKPIETLPTMTEIRERVHAQLQLPIKIFTDRNDVHELRSELSRWIESIQVDGSGHVHLKWKSSAVMELLNLPSSSSGNPIHGDGSSELDSWLPIMVPSVQREANRVSLQSEFEEPDMGLAA